VLGRGTSARSDRFGVATFACPFTADAGPKNS